MFSDVYHFNVPLSEKYLQDLVQDLSGENDHVYFSDEEDYGGFRKSARKKQNMKEFKKRRKKANTSSAEERRGPFRSYPIPPIRLVGLPEPLDHLLPMILFRKYPNGRVGCRAVCLGSEIRFPGKDTVFHAKSKVPTSEAEQRDYRDKLVYLKNQAKSAGKKAFYKKHLAEWEAREHCAEQGETSFWDVTVVVKMNGGEDPISGENQQRFCSLYRGSFMPFSLYPFIYDVRQLPYFKLLFADQLDSDRRNYFHQSQDSPEEYERWGYNDREETDLKLLRKRCMNRGEAGFAALDESELAAVRFKAQAELEAVFVRLTLVQQEIFFFNLIRDVAHLPRQRIFLQIMRSMCRNAAIQKKLKFYEGNKGLNVDQQREWEEESSSLNRDILTALRRFHDFKIEETSSTQACTIPDSSPSRSPTHVGTRRMNPVGVELSGVPSRLRFMSQWDDITQGLSGVTKGNGQDHPMQGRREVNILSTVEEELNVVVPSRRPRLSEPANAVAAADQSSSSSDWSEKKKAILLKIKKYLECQGAVFLLPRMKLPHQEEKEMEEGMIPQASWTLKGPPSNVSRSTLYLPGSRRESTKTSTLPTPSSSKLYLPTTTSSSLSPPSTTTSCSPPETKETRETREACETTPECELILKGFPLKLREKKKKEKKKRTAETMLTPGASPPSPMRKVPKATTAAATASPPPSAGTDILPHPPSTLTPDPLKKMSSAPSVPAWPSSSGSGSSSQPSSTLNSTSKEASSSGESARLDRARPAAEPPGLAAAVSPPPASSQPAGCRVYPVGFTYNFSHQVDEAGKVSHCNAKQREALVLRAEASFKEARDRVLEGETDAPPPETFQVQDLGDFVFPQNVIADEYLPPHLALLQIDQKADTERHLAQPENISSLKEVTGVEVNEKESPSLSYLQGGRDSSSSSSTPSPSILDSDNESVRANAGNPLTDSDGDYMPFNFEASYDVCGGHISSYQFLQYKPYMNDTGEHEASVYLTHEEESQRHCELREKEREDSTHPRKDRRLLLRPSPASLRMRSFALHKRFSQWQQAFIEDEHYHYTSEQLHRFWKELRHRRPMIRPPQKLSAKEKTTIRARVEENGLAAVRGSLHIRVDFRGLFSRSPRVPSHCYPYWSGETSDSSQQDNQDEPCPSSGSRPRRREDLFPSSQPPSSYCPEVELAVGEDHTRFNTLNQTAYKHFCQEEEHYPQPGDAEGVDLRHLATKSGKPTLMQILQEYENNRLLQQPLDLTVDEASHQDRALFNGYDGDHEDVHRCPTTSSVREAAKKYCPRCESLHDGACLMGSGGDGGSSGGVVLDEHRDGRLLRRRRKKKKKKRENRHDISEQEESDDEAYNPQKWKTIDASNPETASLFYL